MFAGAAREAVFSSPAVVERVRREFVPVSLKAGAVANPPSGPEGDLYREIRSSAPAPQGICVVNSSGKVLAWSLMFRDDDAVLEFLDHATRRHEEFPDATRPVPAHRFMSFPDRRLEDHPDRGVDLPSATAHGPQGCPVAPWVRPGTLVGTVIGRPLDEEGAPVAEVVRQENYTEARFTLDASVQRELARAVERAGDDPFPFPDRAARAIAAQPYLGQLDVDPMSGDRARPLQREWDFWGRRIDDAGDEDGDAVGGAVAIRFWGTSDIGAEDAGAGAPGDDGRRWSHRVTLTWRGRIELDGEAGLVQRLLALAEGRERLTWGNRRMGFGGPDVSHLPSGRPIDLDAPVRYGLDATQAPADQVREDAPGREGLGVGPPPEVRERVERLQRLLPEYQRAGGDMRPIQRRMERVGPLARDGRFDEVARLLDEVLEIVE